MPSKIFHYFSSNPIVIIILFLLKTVLEKCVYYKDPSNPDSTLCTKQANIYSPLFGAGAAIERYGLMKFKKSADKASLGLQWISEKILEKFLKSGQ